METIQFYVFLTLMTSVITMSAQPVSLKLSNGCAYNDSQNEKDLLVYDASIEAENIVQQIMDALGLTQNFVLRSSGSVQNALATTEGGQRFIIYSTTFLEKFKADARTKWAAYSVLAHEIGHHLNSHDFGEKDLRKRKIYELEADRFSGSTLRMLGATLEQAQAGLETIQLESETSSHPSKSLRREAVATGWKKKDEHLQGLAGVNLTADSDGDSVPDSRDACPDKYGNHPSGCPDSDEDGIPNKDDNCPFVKGPQVNKGCPDALQGDRDGDGIRDETVKVGSMRKANRLGLFDMSGNVREWCWDWDGDYNTNNQKDPLGAVAGKRRIQRGGDFSSTVENCTVYTRSSSWPAGGKDNNYVRKNTPIGFRIASSFK